MDDAPDPDGRNARYRAYVREREELHRAAIEVSGRYDHWILVLAGGALGLSLVFLEKVTPHPLASSTVLLGLSWGALGAALVLELHAVGSSERAANRQIEILDEDYQDFLDSLDSEAGSPPGSVERNNPHIRRTRHLNAWSIWLLTAGLVFLVAFALINVPAQRMDASSVSCAADSTGGTAVSEKKDESTPTGKRLSKGSYVPPANAKPPPPPPSPKPQPTDSTSSGDTSKESK